MADLEQQVKEIQAARATRQAEQIRDRTQLEVLEQAEQFLVGYADGAKMLLQAARQSKLAGARGALSASIGCPGGIGSSHFGCIGRIPDAILLPSGKDAEQAMSLLDLDQSGRVSLPPLDWLSRLNHSR